VKEQNGCCDGYWRVKEKIQIKSGRGKIILEMGKAEGNRPGTETDKKLEWGHYGDFSPSGKVWVKSGLKKKGLAPRKETACWTKEETRTSEGKVPEKRY